MRNIIYWRDKLTEVRESSKNTELYHQHIQEKYDKIEDMQSSITYYPSPKWRLFYDVCPNCGNKLNITKVNGSCFWYKKYWECAKCGYVYCKDNHEPDY